MRYPIFIFVLIFTSLSFAAPAVDCQDIVNELRALQKNRMDYDSSVVQLVSGGSQTMQTWYNQLSTYEGREVYISYGAFNNMRKYGNELNYSANHYQQNFRKMQDHLYAITESVSACLR